MTNPVSTTDTLTPAFIEMTKDAVPPALGLSCRSAERHLLVAGKSVRLLRTGDRVALRDLHPDRAEVPGTARVLGTFSTTAGTTVVSTAEHGLFQTPGSRLVLMHRTASANTTIE